MASKFVTFVNYIASISPPWLRGFFGERFVGVTNALAADKAAEAATQAIKAPWLRAPTSPDDALPFSGAERNIDRAPAETNAQYRARLVDAWRLWEQAGTEQGLKNALAPFGVPEAAIVIKEEHDWEPDPGAKHWSRFWIIITGTVPWQPVLVGGNLVGDGSTIGSTATPLEIASVRRFVAKWKPGLAVGVFVILAFESQIVGLGNVGSGTLGSKVAYWPLTQFVGAKYPPRTIGSPFPYSSPHIAQVGGPIPL